MITVKNRHKMPAQPLFKEDDDSPQQVYIGRPSPLGNIFEIGRNGSRGEVIEKYRAWIKHESAHEGKVHEELNRIIDLATQYKDVELICFCAPLPCHGDIIKQIVEASIP